jgi:signal transduction histidine kinase
MKREIAERTKSEEALKNNRERLTKLSAHVEHIKEQQRVRLSREIHDDLGGNLVAIKMVLHTIQSRQVIDPGWLAEKIQYIETLIDRTIEAGHRIVLELRPGVLDMGIIAAIEWLTHEFEKQNGIPCTFSSNSADIPILPSHAAAIFRMVQEALTNVAKHAHATQVRVTIVSTDYDITFMVGDNGTGLEKGHENKPNSFGLLGMAERCKEIGGTVWIESKPENGCVVTIKIPL